MISKYKITASLFFILIIYNAIFAEFDPAVFDKTKVDIGNVWQGEIVSVRFTLKNVGPDNIRIINIKGTCLCSKFIFNNDMIKSREQGTFDISFNTKSISGKGQMQFLIQYSYGKENLSKLLYIDYNILTTGKIISIPPILFLQDVEEDMVIDKTLLLKIEGDISVNIISLEAPSYIKEKSIIDNNDNTKTLLLKTKIPHSIDPNDEINVYTDNAHFPLVKIPVLITKAKDIIAIPSNIIKYISEENTKNIAIKVIDKKGRSIRLVSASVEKNKDFFDIILHEDTNELLLSMRSKKIQEMIQDNLRIEVDVSGKRKTLFVKILIINIFRD